MEREALDTHAEMAMSIEDARERRGEPVTFLEGGQMLRGTIEWGDDARGYMVCAEPAGARYYVMARNVARDPGGERPLWARRHGKP